MSSILDALRKLEDAETPRALAGVSAERSRRGAALALAGLVVAFAAGAGATLLLRDRSVPEVPKPMETAAPARAPKLPTAPAAPVPVASAPAHPSAPEPAPAARVATPEPPAAPAAATTPPVTPEPIPPPRAEVAAVAPVPDALPPAAPAPPPAASADAEPPRARMMDVAPPPVKRTEPAREAAPAEPEPAPAVEEARARPPEESPPPAAHDVEILQRPPSGSPAIQVNFLVYSRAPDRRTVTLTIDGSGMVTMREGEMSGDLEIVRILPDRIHVRHAGQLFAVRAIE